MTAAPDQSCEIIAVASGKGGTGKTLILACLGYALQQAEHRVLFVDADTATNGLSLFLLGPRGWRSLAEVGDGSVYSRYLERFAAGSPAGLTPLTINRGRESDHEAVYSALLSGADLYGDSESESAASPDPVISRQAFQAAIGELFDGFRASGEWDYVLVDTRGGFGFNTTDVCALADSFVVVTEPDFTSFYQVRNLFRRIAATALADGKQAICRGIIVNKASEGLTPVVTEDGTHRELDLDRVEASFRSTIESDVGIAYKDTHPIPLDFDAVMAYKAQLIPYRTAPASLFSYASLTAFGGMLSVVTAKWSIERLQKWNKFVDGISEAIRRQSAERLDAARRAEEHERQFEANRKELAELGTRLASSERNAQALQGQLEREIERQQTVLAELRVGRESAMPRRAEIAEPIAFAASPPPPSQSRSPSAPRSQSALVQVLLLVVGFALLSFGIIGGYAIWKLAVLPPPAFSVPPPRQPEPQPPQQLQQSPAQQPQQPQPPSAAPPKMAPPGPASAPLRYK